MAKSYLMARRWALTDQFAITDAVGAPQFEVQGRFGFSRTLTMRDIAGREVAVLSKGVSQQRSLRERFAVQVEDGENPVLLLAVVLAIETIRADRRRAAAAAAAGAGAAGAGA